MRTLSWIIAIIGLSVPGIVSGAAWTIPLGGNGYLMDSVPGSSDRVSPAGIQLQDPAASFSAWFHVDRAAELALSLRLRVPSGSSVLSVSAAGKNFQLNARGEEFQVLELGSLEAPAGYLRVDIRGEGQPGQTIAEISDLRVESTTPDLQLAYVRDDQNHQFYWGRRGPSVHLGYQIPTTKPIEYAYTEIYVPEGSDPSGSFYMANGFGQGYFGLQVKSESERWVLFSVWSPHKTDRPSEIPADSKVLLLKKGKDVRVGEFGGEGSGGQSVLVYPWKSGVTYRLLNSTKPDGKGNTIYTAWFAEAGSSEWRLIASFLRPQTDTHLTGYHSFLENFIDTRGHLERKVWIGNPWVRDIDGEWHEITSARFTGDGTASGNHRRDYAGGLAGSGFYLQNGGFFAENVRLNQSFQRQATPERKPMIDISSLP
ncbi:MAG: DUF3472 domain-containing protein [Luteolibacter sp.]